jgi:hypothetical protein
MSEMIDVIMSEGLDSDQLWILPSDAYRRYHRIDGCTMNINTWLIFYLEHFWKLRISIIRELKPSRLNYLKESTLRIMAALLFGA